MPEHRTPRELLLEVLGSRGVHIVGVKSLCVSRDLVRHGFQKITLEVLLDDAVLCEDSIQGEVVRAERYSNTVFKIVAPPGTVRSDAILTGRERCSKRVLVSSDTLLRLMPEKARPLFVIDLSLLRSRDLVDADDSIDVDIAKAVEHVREHLWDGNLAIAGFTQGFPEIVESMVGKNRLILTAKTSAELLWSLDVDRVAVITGIASKPLVAEEVFEYDAFVFTPPVYWSDSRIRGQVESLVPWGKLRRVELRGSTVGVPRRPSQLLCVVLKTLYELQGDLDRAVVSCMSLRDRRRRLVWEVEARARRGFTGSYVTIEDYREIASWLPVTLEEFKRVCELLGLKTKGF